MGLEVVGHAEHSHPAHVRFVGPILFQLFRTDFQVYHCVLIFSSLIATREFKDIIVYLPKSEGKRRARVDRLRDASDA
jgi:hypothetical protein